MSFEMLEYVIVQDLENKGDLTLTILKIQRWHVDFGPAVTRRIQSSLLDNSRWPGNALQ